MASYAYYKYDNLSNCRDRFIRLMDYKMPESYAERGVDVSIYEDGYTAGVHNLKMDVSNRPCASSHPNYDALLEQVQSGDIIYIFKLEEVFNSVDSFIEGMKAIKARGLHLVAIDDDFCSDTFDIVVMPEALRLTKELLDIENKANQSCKKADYPEGFALLYDAIEDRTAKLGATAQQVGISVPTLRKLMIAYSK